MFSTTRQIALLFNRGNASTGRPASIPDPWLAEKIPIPDSEHKSQRWHAWILVNVSWTIINCCARFPWDASFIFRLHFSIRFGGFRQFFALCSTVLHIHMRRPGLMLGRFGYCFLSTRGNACSLSSTICFLLSTSTISACKYLKTTERVFLSAASHHLRLHDAWSDKVRTLAMSSTPVHSPFGPGSWVFIASIGY